MRRFRSTGRLIFKPFPCTRRVYEIQPFTDARLAKTQVCAKAWKPFQARHALVCSGQPLFVQGTTAIRDCSKTWKARASTPRQLGQIADASLPASRRPSMALLRTWIRHRAYVNETTAASIDRLSLFVRRRSSRESVCAQYKFKRSFEQQQKRYKPLFCIEIAFFWSKSCFFYVFCFFSLSPTVTK